MGYLDVISRKLVRTWLRLNVVKELCLSFVSYNERSWVWINHTRSTVQISLLFLILLYFFLKPLKRRQRRPYQSATIQGRSWVRMLETIRRRVVLYWFVDNQRFTRCIRFARGSNTSHCQQNQRCRDSVDSGWFVSFNVIFFCITSSLTYHYLIKILLIQDHKRHLKRLFLFSSIFMALRGPNFTLIECWTCGWPPFPEG